MNLALRKMRSSPFVPFNPKERIKPFTGQLIPMENKGINGTSDAWEKPFPGISGFLPGAADSG